ncbi:MAG TPA: helix-turn-helix transcriptional regulator, partial [Streptosporangiaceae bacterium]
MNAPDESGMAGNAGRAETGTSRAGDAGRTRADEAGALETLGRSSGPASLILSSLADGPKHGYALTKDIEAFAGIRLAPGTLYEALSRLESHRMIEAVESNDRRRPYRLTATG